MFLCQEKLDGKDETPFCYCGYDGVNAWDPSGHKKKAIKMGIVLLSLLMIFCSGCSYNQDIKIPEVTLFEDYVDCN